jgi:hypothetical protein
MGLMKGMNMTKKSLAKRIAAAKEIKNIDEKILTLALLLPKPEKLKFVLFLERLRQNPTQARSQLRKGNL